MARKAKSIINQDSYPLKDTVVIFENPALRISYAPNLKKQMYSIEDNRLCDPKQKKKLKNMISIFSDKIYEAIGSKKDVIKLQFNPFVALLLDDFIKMLKKDKQIKWLVLSFFHKEREIKQTIVDSSENLVLLSTALFNEMTVFPFIQKYHVPVGYEIDRQYLKRLLEEANYINIDYKVSCETIKRKINLVGSF
jgi:hypothetical protein